MMQRKKSSKKPKKQLPDAKEAVEEKVEDVKEAADAKEAVEEKAEDCQRSC